MTEAFVHYLWQCQYFSKHALETTQGETLQVLHPGFRNDNAGPDFYHARIRIGPLEWVGTVEIHINASGWMSHMHHVDRAYENVILHVVWTDDKPAHRADGSPIPTLVLGPRVDVALLEQYRDLMHHPGTIACAQRIGTVSPLARVGMLDRALLLRLEAKAMAVAHLQQRNANDWEETCYQLLARNFGFKINAEPFQQLASALPHKILRRHAGNLLQVEALLFGQAGFLEAATGGDEYYSSLQREYHLLRQKYQLAGKQLNKSQWRFLRLRPANFPTLRLAQFAAVMAAGKSMFASLVDYESVAQVAGLLSVQQGSYWRHHYHFRNPAREEVSALGAASVDNILINTVVPLMVAYGKSKDEQRYVDRAVAILQQVHAEANAIINTWRSVGITCKTAFDSQALVELYNNFCLKRRCLECSIGAALVNPRST